MLYVDVFCIIACTFSANQIPVPKMLKSKAVYKSARGVSNEAKSCIRLCILCKIFKDYTKVYRDYTHFHVKISEQTSIM